MREQELKTKDQIIHRQTSQGSRIKIPECDRKRVGSRHGGAFWEGSGPEGEEMRASVSESPERSGGCVCVWFPPGLGAALRSTQLTIFFSVTPKPSGQLECSYRESKGMGVKRNVASFTVSPLLMATRTQSLRRTVQQPQMGTSSCGGHGQAC